MQGTMSGTIMSMLMLAGLVLTGGGVYVWAKLHNRKQALLMWTAAAVMFANVAIWVIPVAGSVKPGGNPVPPAQGSADR